MIPSFDVVTIILVAAGIAFLASEQVLIALFGMMKSRESALSITSLQIERLSRIETARLILKLMSVLLKAAFALALGLGLLKAMADVALLILPDRTLGFAVLMGYSGLIAAFQFVRDDILDVLKKLIVGE